MTEYSIVVVDAFTQERYAGNPCAVVSRADGLDDVRMQAIAREMNLSETAFVFPSSNATFRVRFFTPQKEIPLAGHPTIATMFTLADEGRIEEIDDPVCDRLADALLASLAAHPKPKETISLV